MEESLFEAKEDQLIPSVCYVIEQRERSALSATRHRQTSMSSTWNKPRLARLLHKTEIMKRLGGLVFLFGIPFCFLGCILTFLSYTNSATKESSHIVVFSILGPVLIVLSFLSFIFGCLRDGEYQESNLPTIGRLPFGSFQNGEHITKDVSHFEKHKYDSRAQYKILTHSKPYYNILNHLKQKNSSVYRQDIQYKEHVLNSVKGMKSTKTTPPENTIGRTSSNRKGILKIPSNLRSTLRTSNTTKTVDFALVTHKELDDSQLKKNALSLALKSETIVRDDRIISATDLWLWAISKTIKMMVGRKSKHCVKYQLSCRIFKAKPK